MANQKTACREGFSLVYYNMQINEFKLDISLFPIYLLLYNLRMRFTCIANLILLQYENQSI